MAKFDVYNVGKDRYVVDCQSDLIERFETRIAAPLVLVAGKLLGVDQLHPQVTFQGRNYYLATQLITAVPELRLGHPVGHLRGHREAISRALDVLITGF